MGLQQGEAHLCEGKFVSVEKYPLAQLVKMAMSGEIKDGKTLVDILKTNEYLKQQQKD